MSKQWGHGNQKGKVDALRCAAEATKHLQEDGVYAMALLHKLMNTHPDKTLVDEADKAMRQSKKLSSLYADGLWHGMGAGMFVETHPPMSKNQGIEMIFNEARKHGWSG